MPFAASIAKFEVKVGGTWTAMPLVATATLKGTRAAVDTTEWNDDYSRSLPGVNYGTITVDGYFDHTNAQFAAIESAYFNAAKIEFRISVNALTPRLYSSIGYITDYEVTASAKDIVKARFTLTTSAETLVT